MSPKTPAKPPAPAPEMGRPLLPVAAHGPWTVLGVQGSGDLVVAFASIGHDASRPPSPEFVAAATAGGRSALFVMDAARSWGTAPGLAQVLRLGLTRMQPCRVLMLGASMGGFVALLAAERMGADAVLAIGPQSQPAHPEETRWRDWTHTLPPDLTAPLPNGPRITLLHGTLDDTAQAMRFTPRQGVDHILFPALTHSALGPHLKTQGMLAGLVQAAIDGDRRRLLRLTSGAGGVRRVRDARLPAGDHPDR